MPILQKVMVRYVCSAIHIIFMVLVAGMLFFKRIPIGDSLIFSLIALSFILLAGVMPIGFALHEAYHKKADFWYVYGRSGMIMMVMLLIFYLGITGQFTAMMKDLFQ